MTSSSKREEELDAFMARTGPLSHAWEAAVEREEPPPELDRAIRTSARSALQSGLGTGHARRWRVPASIAALVVIGGALTLMITPQREHVASMRPRAASPPPSATDSPRVDASPSNARDVAGDSLPAEVESSEAARPSERPSNAPRSQASRLTKLGAPSKATPEPAQAKVLDQSAVETQASVTAPAVPMEDARSDMPSAVNTQAAALPPTASTPDEGTLNRNTFRKEAKSSFSAPRGALEPITELHPKAAPIANRQTTQRPEPSKLEREQYSPAEIANSTLTPDQWLRRIAELRGTGKYEEAKRNLALFRERYPYYPLPEELR